MTAHTQTIKCGRHQITMLTSMAEIRSVEIVVCNIDAINAAGMNQVWKDGTNFYLRLD